MEISAKAADPNGQNGERETVLAIAKVCGPVNLFRQYSSIEKLRAVTPLADYLDASGLKRPLHSIACSQLPVAAGCHEHCRV
jgi:hypothetical protein